MTELHTITSLTKSDEERLRRNLTDKKKDFRLEVIIFGAILFIAPYLTNRPGQKPLIENMSYWEAVGFFSLFLLIPLIITYFSKLHNAVVGFQTDKKRVIVTTITDKTKNPAFRKDFCRFNVKDEYLKRFFLEKYQFEKFAIGDTVKIEISELGKQLIKVVKATDKLIETALSKKNESESAYKKPYFEILFGVKTGEKLSFKETFSFFIPADGHFITPIILDLNILIYILMIISGVKVYKPEVIDIVNWGGNVRILTIDNFQYWRLITNCFVHIGVVHIFMNCIGFIFAAIFVEGILGRILFSLLYLFCGIIASLTSVFWHDNIVSAGASGAIFGLYGFLLTTLIFAKKEDRKMNSGLIISILIYIGYNLLYGLTGGVDNAAHVGGLVSGFAVGTIMSLIKREESATTPQQKL